MQEIPLISVIVPVYNMAPYLTKCLNSVLAQTYTNWELLLVDDGSTDASSHICDAFAVRDNRIGVFHQENQGVSSARNLALENAKGEWLFFLDSDDWLAVDCLAYLFELARQTGSPLVVMGRWEVLRGQASPVESLRPQLVKCLSSDQAMEQYCLGRFYHGVAGKLYHRRLFAGIVFPLWLANAEDIYVNYQVFCNVDSIAVGDGKKYYRLLRTESACHCGYAREQAESLIKLADRIHQDMLSRFGRFREALSCLEVEILSDILAKLNEEKENAKIEKEVACLAKYRSKHVRFFTFLPWNKRIKYWLLSISPISYKRYQRQIKRSEFRKERSSEHIS